MVLQKVSFLRPCPLYNSKGVPCPHHPTSLNRNETTPVLPMLLNKLANHCLKLLLQDLSADGSLHLRTQDEHHPAAWSWLKCQTEKAEGNKEETKKKQNHGTNARGISECSEPVSTAFTMRWNRTGPSSPGGKCLQRKQNRWMSWQHLATSGNICRTWQRLQVGVAIGGAMCWLSSGWMCWLIELAHQPHFNSHQRPSNIDWFDWRLLRPMSTLSTHVEISTLRPQGRVKTLRMKAPKAPGFGQWPWSSAKQLLVTQNRLPIPLYSFSMMKHNVDHCVDAPLVFDMKQALKTKTLAAGLLATIWNEHEWKRWMKNVSCQDPRLFSGWQILATQLVPSPGNTAHDERTHKRRGKNSETVGTDSTRQRPQLLVSLYWFYCHLSGFSASDCTFST